MKQLTFLTKFFFLFLAISFWSSCEDDGTGGGTGITLPPVVELQSGAGFVTSATTVDAGATFNVSILADKGDNDMTTFTVLEDGLAIDASRISYNGGTAGQLSNPYSLTTAEGTTFSTEVGVAAHTDGGTRTYTFRITDSAGETDDSSVDITVVTTPLSLGFSSANGGISSDVTLPNQTNFKVELAATKGGSPLNSLTVFEDDVAVDASRIRFGVDNDITAATTATSNPIGLIDGEKDGFNWFVWVNSHDSGTKTYRYEVADEAANTETLSIAVTIQMQTAVVELTGKLLKNSDGPTGTGGIDLITGDGTGSADMAAHLKDEGIDLNLPTSSNWLKNISAVNGATLRVPGTDFPVNDFDAVQFSEDISIAFDNGTDVSTTGVVVIGDRYLVRAAGGTTFLVLVTDIVETTNNNEDFYQLSIKY